jgi:ribosome recycling factor
MKKTAPEFIVRIHRPELTPEEREQRMKEIKRAAEMFARSTLKKSECVSGGKT